MKQKMYKKRSVLHVINGLSPGGAERALTNLLSSAESSGCEHVIFSLRSAGFYKPILEAAGHKVIDLGLDGFWTVPLVIWRCVRYVFARPPTVIQGWMYQGNLIALLCWACLRYKPVLLWNIRHGLDSIKTERPFTRVSIFLCKLASRCPEIVIYNSRRSMAQHADLGFCAGNQLHIPNGFAEVSLNPADSIRSDLALGIPKSYRLIGHVGRFHETKDHRTFVLAALAVLSKMPLVGFVMVGQGVSWANQRFAELIPTPQRGHFFPIGEIADVSKVYSALEILCVTSIAEAFPNVLGEAMAHGVPTVVTNVGDCKVIQGGHGLVVEPQDVDSMQEAICNLLALGEDEVAKIRVGARKHLKEFYSHVAVCAQYSSLYSSDRPRDSHLSN